MAKSLIPFLAQFARPARAPAPLDLVTGADGLLRPRGSATPAIDDLSGVMMVTIITSAPETNDPDHVRSVNNPRHPAALWLKTEVYSVRPDDDIIRPATAARPSSRGGGTVRA